MKRCLILLLMFLSLGAYELGFDTWNTYTVFDPEQRTMGMTYPVSWLCPENILLDPQYDDSSSTFAQWEQFVSFAGSGVSNKVLAQYIPYSTPQRWSLGMNFTSYLGPSPTKRSDMVFDYRHNRGEFKAYHTSHSQTFNMSHGRFYHNINSSALNFDHKIAEKFILKGGIDFQIIEQENATDDSVRNYNAHHEYVQGTYQLSRLFQVYGKFEYRYFQNDERHNTMMVFRPGLKYKKGIFMGHLAMRISPNQVFPIAELSLRPGALFFNVFAKVRNPLFIIKQPGYQYFGFNTGIDHQGKHQDLSLKFQLTYDYTNIPAYVVIIPYIPYNFFMMDISAEYALKIKNSKVYVEGDYHNDFKAIHYYYHPQIAAITGGFAWKGKVIDGKLLLEGDINAQYMLHDDPDSVSFDPETMIYSKTFEASPVGSWKLNFKLKAIIKTFDISLNISSPLNFNKDIDWHFYDGIRSTSDLLTGNTFYAGLTISWLWWK